MTDQPQIIGGIDTHTDVHQAAVIDTFGRRLATAAFPTTPAGYHQLLDWLRSYGTVTAVGVEGTGAYGAELARLLRANRVSVIEVDRPDRRTRRAHGKSDPLDAYAAADAVLAHRAQGTPRPATGSWRPSAPCAWYAPPPSKPAPRPPTRSTHRSPPRPARCANRCAHCPPPD
jgi:transposase